MTVPERRYVGEPLRPHEPGMTSTTDQRQADRRAYLDLTRTAQALRLESRGMLAVATQATRNPDFGEYAEQRRAICAHGYEQMGVDLAALADDAQQKADSYFEILGIES